MDFSINIAKRRTQSVTPDWERVHDSPMIDGVQIKEMKNVLTRYGHLCEIYRDDWALEDSPLVGQIFQMRMMSGFISAWHIHEKTTDRLFPITGIFKVVLYDDRAASDSYRIVNEFIIGEHRPALIVVPPGVWHGVQNISNNDAILLNAVDQAYQYQNPDHWDIPLTSKEIPYTW